MATTTQPQSPTPDVAPPTRLQLGLVVDLARVAEQPLAREHRIRRGQLQILANKLIYAGYCRTPMSAIFNQIVKNGQIPWQLDHEDLALLRLLYSLW